MADNKDNKRFTGKRNSYSNSAKNYSGSKNHSKSYYKKPNKPEKTKPSIKIAFLGGLNEIGKNITMFECEGDIVLLDCGMAFPDGDMLGVDLVIPDFTYIEQNIDRVKGMVVTRTI